MREKEAAPSTGQDEPQRETGAVINARSLAFTLPPAANWAWYFALMFSDVAIIPLPSTLHIEPQFRLLFLVASVCGFLALLRWGKKILSPVGRKASAAVVVLCSPWCPLLVMAAHQTGFISLPLLAASWICAGLSFAATSFWTALFLKDLRRFDSALCVGLLSSIGSVLYFALTNIALTDSLACLALLPFTSIFVMRALSDEPFEDTAAEGKGFFSQAVKASFVSQPTQPLYGIASGLAISIGVSASVFETGGFPVPIAVAFCAAGPAVIVFSIFISKVDVRTAQWFLLAAIIIGILPIILASRSITLACCALLSFCYSFYDLTHTFSLAELMREQSDCALQVMNAGMALKFVGVTIGWGLGLLTLTTVGYYTQVFSLFIIGVAALLIVAMAVLGKPSHGDSTTETIEFAENVEKVDFDHACNSLCSSYGLSPRQAEIFKYLAKGRNASYIESELVVSYHTVKAHIYRIYQKLDVHSQQELIDLIETQLDSGKSQV